MSDFWTWVGSLPVSPWAIVVVFATIMIQSHRYSTDYDEHPGTDLMLGQADVTDT